MPFKDLREFLDLLEKKGELLRIKRQVDVKYEIAAGIRKISDTQGPALFFENIRGYATPVVGGVFATRKRAMLALEMKEDLITRAEKIAKTNLEVMRNWVENLGDVDWIPPEGGLVTFPRFYRNITSKEL